MPTIHEPAVRKPSASAPSYAHLQDPPHNPREVRFVPSRKPGCPWSCGSWEPPDFRGQVVSVERLEMFVVANSDTCSASDRLIGVLIIVVIAVAVAITVAHRTLQPRSLFFPCV